MNSISADMLDKVTYYESKTLPDSNLLGIYIQNLIVKVIQLVVSNLQYIYSQIFYNVSTLFCNTE